MIPSEVLLLTDIEEFFIHLGVEKPEAREGGMEYSTKYDNVILKCKTFNKDWRGLSEFEVIQYEGSLYFIDATYQGDTFMYLLVGITPEGLLDLIKQAFTNSTEDGELREKGLELISDHESYEELEYKFKLQNFVDMYEAEYL